MNDMEYSIFYMSYCNIYDSFGIQIKPNYILFIRGLIDEAYIIQML